MKTEVLIYAYLAVCAAMIGFNIVCIFVFRMKDRRLERYSRRFIDMVNRAVAEETVPEEHCRYLARKLKRTGNMMAFDRTLEELFAREPEQTELYLRQLSDVFIGLTLEYKKKGKVQAAYYPYIIQKYKIFRGRPVEIVMDTLLELVRSDSLYVRENALQAVYSVGSVEGAMNALWILNESRYYHSPKMLTDGLLNFPGDHSSLAECLWENFDRFSRRMQGVIINYFRFSSPDHRERILALLTGGTADDEMAYSCIRYLGKYPYAPAYPTLIAFAENPRVDRWEYAAISAAALAGYPGDRTTAALKRLLENPNWHVRFNASQSLMSLGLFYTDLIDVFEGQDRYAGEIMRYRFDQKKMMEKEAVGVE